MSWEHLEDWWIEEVADPAYEEVVTPLLVEVLQGQARGGVVADLGSGTGRLMGPVADLLRVDVVGLEINLRLAKKAGGGVVVGRLPGIPMATDSVDGAYAVLVLDHLENHGSLFAEAARVVRPGGFLAIVSNHPVWTAPGSTPITDTDGEILWRPGEYFGAGSTTEPAGNGEIVFHHRSMAEILNKAAEAGWSLERMVERPHGGADSHPGIPRLLGIRWRRL